MMEASKESRAWDVLFRVYLTTRLRAAFFFLSCYYVVGITAFVLVERPAELASYVDNRALFSHMKEMYKFEYCNEKAFQTLSFCESQAKMDEALKDYFNQHGPNALEDKGQWTLVGALFFLTHLTTTIGYGHSHPTTPAGQMMTVLFAILGLPLMAYTLALIGEMHLRHCQAFIAKFYGPAEQARDANARRMFILWSLIAFFMIAGAAIYTLLENWSFFESLYFCFVTLTTIGFGDYLPSSIWSRLFSVFYMISGLGVCASLIGALTGLVSEAQSELLENLRRKFGAEDQETSPVRA